MSIYSIKMKDIDGKSVDFSKYKGKKLLIVNTASECGYTPQLSDLQKLHEQYGEKVTVIGIPCNQFGGQEPGSSDEIKSFCSKNYGVTFQMFEKADVKGNNTCDLYKWLTDKSLNGWNEQSPTWNFCKYLVDESGNLLSFFPPSVKPMDDKILSHLK